LRLIQQQDFLNLQALQTALRTLLYICYYITEAEKVQFNFR